MDKRKPLILVRFNGSMKFIGAVNLTQLIKIAIRYGGAPALIGVDDMGSFEFVGIYPQMPIRIISNSEWSQRMLKGGEVRGTYDKIPKPVEEKYVANVTGFHRALGRNGALYSDLTSKLHERVSSIMEPIFGKASKLDDPEKFFRSAQPWRFR